MLDDPLVLFLLKGRELGQALLDRLDNVGLLLFSGEKLQAISLASERLWNLRYLIREKALCTLDRG